MNLDEVLHHRRSVRVYDKEKPIDTEKVKHCLELATLAPNSSDMQLWEFYHITEPELLAKISRDCLGQKAASTASQIVIFVVRRYLYNSKLRSPCPMLHKLSFLWFGVTGTRNMRDSYSILNGRTFVITVLKNVRPNVLRIGKYITVY